MRILQLAENYTVGGGGISNYVREVSGLLSEHHVENGICYRYSRNIRNASIPLFHLDPDLNRAEQVRKLFEVIRVYNPTHIYCHTLDLPELVKEATRRVPIVGYVHAPNPVCPGLAKYFRRSHQICDRPVSWKCALMIYRERCSNARNPFTVHGIVSSTKKLLGAYTDLPRIFVASNYMRNLLIQNQFNPSRIQVLPPHFVNRDGLTNPVRRESHTVLYVGRLEWGKGLEHLLAAMARLSPTIRLLVAGSGSQENIYRGIVEQLGIHPQVSFLGQVSPESLTPLYQRSLCVVLPTILPEAFGKVGIEAMSHGCPVIATNVGGIPDWLTHGYNGLLVEPGTPTEIAGAIRQLAESPSIIEHLSRNAFISSQAPKYSPHTHMETLLSAFHEVAAET